MKIVCTNTTCNAVYELPSAMAHRALGKGVRCKRCGHVWVPNAGAPAPVATHAGTMARSAPTSPDLSASLARSPESAVRPEVATSSADLPSDWMLKNIRDLIGTPPVPSILPHKDGAFGKADGDGAARGKHLWWGQPGRQRHLIMVAWGGSALVVAGGLMTVFLARATLAGIWPPITRLYSLLGLGWN